MNAEVLAPGRKKARIEIIPLIDVVFFLLATFVLFVLSLDKISGLPVNLPRVPPIPIPEARTLFIQTSDQGTVYWKEGDTGTPQLMSFAELPARLAEYQVRNSAPRVLVRADGKAKFGAAVSVFDEVRRAGISQVSMETIPSRTAQ